MNLSKTIVLNEIQGSLGYGTYSPLDSWGKGRHASDDPPTDSPRSARALENATAQVADLGSPGEHSSTSGWRKWRDAKSHQMIMYACA